MRGLPADLAVRDLTLADSSAAAALVHSCDETYREWAEPGWEPQSVESEKARWERVLTRSPRRAQGVFDAAGDLFGAVGWRQAEDESAGAIPGVAHVYAVFTHPERWGEGIAAALLGRAEAAMSAAGFERARLWTPRDAPARAFYERQGWSRDGRARWEDEMQLDLVGYEKALSPEPP